MVSRKLKAAENIPDEVISPRWPLETRDLIKKLQMKRPFRCVQKSQNSRWDNSPGIRTWRWSTPRNRPESSGLKETDRAIAFALFSFYCRKLYGEYLRCLFIEQTGRFRRKNCQGRMPNLIRTVYISSINIQMERSEIQLTWTRIRWKCPTNAILCLSFRPGMGFQKQIQQQ